MLRDEPLTVRQTALQVKDLFTEFCNKALEPDLFLQTEPWFPHANLGLISSGYEGVRGQPDPSAAHEFDGVFGQPLQIERVDRSLLGSLELGGKDGAAGRILQVMGGGNDLFQQVPAFPEIAERGSRLAFQPGADVG